MSCRCNKGHAAEAAFSLTLLAFGCAVLQGQTHTIRAGVVLDGRGNVALNQVIQIDDGKISWIGTSTATPDIDLSSDTVMPGWIGACLPVSDADSVIEAESKAYRLMKSGFTTVISPSHKLRDLIDDQRWAGPRMVSHGNCSVAAKFFDLARQGSPVTANDLANVTSRAAEELGIADHTGSVLPGMLADLVATRGNPLVDGTALRAVVYVMKDGHIYLEPEKAERRKLIRRF